MKVLLADVYFTDLTIFDIINGGKQSIVTP